TASIWSTLHGCTESYVPVSSPSPVSSPGYDASRSPMRGKFLRRIPRAGSHDARIGTRQSSDKRGKFVMHPNVWLLAACFAFAPMAANANESVDLTLVLVTDVSRSIDDAEFKLEKEGYAAAFTSRPVIDA